MTQYKEGDRVKSPGYSQGVAWDVEAGTLGTVKYDDGHAVKVMWDGWDTPWYYDYDNVDALEDGDDVKYVQYLGGGLRVPSASTANPDEYAPGNIDAHYRKMGIEPLEYSMANGFDAMQHTIIKYVSRFRDKNGIRDLYAAKNVLDMLIEREQSNAANG